MDITGGALVGTLFIIYFLLWKIKRVTQINKTGIDPEVLKTSKSNLQRYMGVMLNLLTVYAILLIIFHTANLQFYSWFSRLEGLDQNTIKYVGFVIGIIGLCCCLYAQVKMGKSWRVGIDENIKTELVTTGLYRIIRNPTYLGLYILNIGVWLIWPTWTIFILNVFFIYTLEFQVRCEEDYLEIMWGKEYTEYKGKTKRYIPFIY
ncbi:MAG: isoprenylcysteine carboxylmethyltransferase family protein [Syntrophomonadaceae bacterium]|nr:isoprenylcysteine carboxylmethyltransferase family protein [Syntrophomonadaceae bacterium]